MLSPPLHWDSGILFAFRAHELAAGAILHVGMAFSLRPGGVRLKRSICMKDITKNWLIVSFL